MRPLTSLGALDVWERGQGHGSTARALALLAAAWPEAAWEELAALPLGERDRRLLALREEALGCRVEIVARCPACGEALDVALDARALRSAAAGEVPSERELSRAGLTLRMRPANSLDLLAAEGCSGIEEARRRLAGRCLLEAHRGGEPMLAEALTDEDLEVLATGLAEADPGAELLIELQCPACGHGWADLLDVASFFWMELDSLVRRLLREVHVLARAYGWREADVLALSPRRRRIYLEMVGA